MRNDRSRMNIGNNSGSVGYSKEALEKLNAGLYQGRKQKYRTSKEQAESVSKKVPALEGMTRSPSFDQTGHVDTANARAKYEQKINHKPIGRGLSSEDAETLYKVFDRNRLSSGGNKAIAHQLRNNIWVNTSDWENKYGKSIEQIVDDYSKDYEKIAARKNVEQGKGNKVSTTLGNIFRGGTVEPALDLESTILGKIAPNNELTKAVRNASEKYAKQKAQTVEGVTSDMGNTGKQVYNFATGLAEKGLQYANPSKLKYALTLGKTAENERQNLKERGIEGTSAELQSGLAGLTDAALDVIGFESIPALKGLAQSGNLGKEILGRFLIGGGEQGLTELINKSADRGFNGQNSLHGIRVQDYINQGMSVEDAERQANVDDALEVGQSVVSGGLLNNALGLGGKAISKALNSVPTLSRNKAEQMTDDLTIARRQAQEGKYGVKHFDKLVDTDARKVLDKRGKLTNVLESNPNIKRSYNGMPKSAELIASDMNKLKTQMDDYAHGRMRENDLFDCGTTPDVLKDNGVLGNKIMMSQKVYDKISLPEGFVKNDKTVNYHGLDTDGVIKIVNGLNDPALTMISDKGDSVLAVVNYTSKGGTPVLVPIFIGKDGTIKHIGETDGSARITSAYIRGNLDAYIEKRANQVTYIKGDDDSASNGFRNAALKSSSLNSNIPTNPENVNSAPVKTLAESVRRPTKTVSLESLNKEINDLSKAIEDKYVEYKNVPKTKKRKVWSEYEELKKTKAEKQYELRNAVRSNSGLAEIPKRSADAIDEFKADIWTAGKMFGGKDGRKLAKTAADALDRFEKSGSQEDLKDFIQATIALKNGSTETYTNKNGQTSTYLTKFSKETGSDLVDRIMPSPAGTKPSSMWTALGDILKKAEVPEETTLAPTLDNNYNIVQNTVPTSSMDVPHQLAQRMAQLMSDFDFYDYADNIGEMDVFIERMANDIANGKDVRGYIDVLAENMDDVDDPEMLARMQSLVDDLAKIQTYEAYKNGTQVAESINPIVSEEVKPGDRVRSFSRRGSVDETLPEEIRNTLSEDYYKVARNADTEARAESLFDPDNLIQTRSNLDRAVEAHDPAAALLSYNLAKAYIDGGNYDAATDVLQSVSAELTKMGQFTQAAKLAMLQNDPMAAMNSYVRDLNKLNAWGQKKYKDKWNNLELTKEDIDAFNSIPKGDSEALNNLTDQLNARFSKEIPASWWDKAVTASKTAMLLNFRTQSRNVLANVAMLPIRSMSDRVSALGQGAAYLINNMRGKDYQRTQSLTGGTKQQKAVAEQIWDQLKDEITGENKMKDSVKSDILSQRQMFNDDFFAKWIDNLTNGGIQKLNEKFGANGNQSTMQTLTNLTYWLMGDVGDTPFVKKNFVNRLASYMKAQGIDRIEDVPDEAKAIATQEALKATFKDDNAFTKALQGVKEKSGKFGEVALPFVKTPANLTMRSIDYSPAGLINTFRKIKSGAEANAVIDELSKNLTGTAMIYLGYKLAENGLLSGSYSSDPDEAAFQKQQGVLENAIHAPERVPFVGDKYLTYDWMQPAATPLVLGQTIYEAIKASDDENANALDVLNATYKGGLKVANTIINSSPLQSLADLLGDNPYGEEGIAENITNEILDFPQRFIPSVVGATARTLDPTIRDTYIKDATLTGAVGNQLRQAEAKIPFLSKNLPASYDTWGNERTRSDSKGQAFFAQMVNPGQFGNKNETPLDAEIQRIFDETGNNAVFPLYAPRSLDLGSDGSRTLTNKEHSDYQKNLGKRSYSYAESIMNNPEYQSLSDDEKAGILEKAYKLSNALTKEEMFDHVTDSDKKLKEVARNGSAKDVAQYLIDGVKAKNQGTTIDKYLKSKTSESNDTEQKAIPKVSGSNYKVVPKGTTANQNVSNVSNSTGTQSAKDLGIKTEQYNKIADKAGNNAEKVYNAVPELKRAGLGAASAYYQYADALSVDPSLSSGEFIDTFNAVDTDNSKGIKQDELIDYFNKNKYSQQQANRMWRMYGDSKWKKVPALVNGTFVKK